MAITSDTGKPESRLPVGDAHTGESERARFEKNANLERLLARINDYLRAAEQAQPAPPELDFPLILLVGAPRSGTTLFMQWLDATGAIGVPSNLISRFFVAPAFGVMLQRLLTDPMYRYREELDWPGELSPSLASDLGKTKGLLGHNSFFYFWRQFISLTEPAEMTHAQLSRVDKDGLARAVRRFAAEIGKPLAMKGYLVQYHLRLLESILDRVLFVHITRDPIAVMASLLAVRRRLHGHERAWWGCRPPGYEALEKAEPALQVAGQIALTNKSIEPNSRLCRPPNRFRSATNSFAPNPQLFGQCSAKK